MTMTSEEFPNCFLVSWQGWSSMRWTWHFSPTLKEAGYTDKLVVNLFGSGISEATRETWRFYKVLLWSTRCNSSEQPLGCSTQPLFTLEPKSPWLECRASNPNCEADDARELGLCSFAFQLCLFVAKPGHTRASAERQTLICEATYGRELGLSCFCFPTLFLC
jgi:hypothetical protein